MTNVSDALIRAESAESAAADLLRRLSTVRVELLDLERLGGTDGVGRQVVGRADEVRRELVGPLSRTATSIRDALHAVEAAYFGGSASGEIDVEHARTMIGVVLQSAREVRYLQLAINDTADAMRDIAAVMPEDLQTSRLLSRSLQQASTSLEQAQRGAYRANEDLVTITRSLSVDVAGLVGDRVEAGAELPHDPGRAARLDHDRAGVVDVERLRHDLAADHAELVEIELLIRLYGSSVLVVDRAEDLRRSLRDQRREQAQGIRDVLHQAEKLLLEKGTAGGIDRGSARSMTTVVLQAAREVRRLQLDLASVVDSLTPLAQSSPTGELTAAASDGIAEAKAGLDRARRSALRVSTDLPVVARTIVPEHERPVALSLVLLEEVERLTPARTGRSRTRAEDPALPISQAAPSIGVDR
ncbi:MAG: hypothetical protein P1U38_08905 [Aeromicrobium sp.]|uniref:hypothetical protein n=1 Tax=Aeromicrobium sp. TaxID=1871063 RepID=UPI0026381829|nr:hypothetical protein [Aeromicrobium sp.]MDF1704881.1 hypothetical protein [Aeromicrobium sp.]